MGEQLTIPGEPLLAQRLREAAGRDALGHALILSGQGDLPAAARFAAAAMECIGEGRPCGMCLPCRKVMRGVHPDIVTVTDPDHKNISVDVLRDVVADAYTLPNEGRRKVYVFPDCALLEAKAQNVLLKVVEDGPPHAAFLFCAANSAALLPTIRSRAVEWKLSNPEPARRRSLPPSARPWRRGKRSGRRSVACSPAPGIWWRRAWPPATAQAGTRLPSGLPGRWGGVACRRRRTRCKAFSASAGPMWA